MSHSCKWQATQICAVQTLPGATHTLGPGATWLSPWVTVASLSITSHSKLPKAVWKSHMARGQGTHLRVALPHVRQ